MRITKVINPAGKIFFYATEFLNQRCATYRISEPRAREYDNQQYFAKDSFLTTKDKKGFVRHSFQVRRVF